MTATSDPLTRLQDLLLRAAVAPDAWHEVQLAAEDYLGSFGSQIAVIDHANGNAFWGRSTQVPELDAWFAEIAPTSEPVLYAARNPGWRRFSDFDYITPEAIARSEFYNACFRIGIGYRLVLRLVDTPNVSKAIAFFWRPEHGPVEPQAIARLGRVEDRFRLAAEVADRIGGGDPARTCLLEIFETTGQPALIATPQAGVIDANAAAAAILRAQDGLVLRRGLLETAGPRSRRALAAALAGAGGHVPVSRPSGRRPWMLTIAPLPRAPVLFGPERASLLVLIADPDASRPPASGLLESAFGLTPAEAAICRRFATGASPSEIADERGVGLGSLRGQIKSAMAKLGVARQSELMRLLNSLPPD